MTDKPAVLLIDDDAEVLSAYRQTLDLEGFAVRASQSGPKALAGLARNFPGIVLTDLRMPGIDGLGVLERVRAIDPDIPVVLITGHGDVATAIKAVRDGAYDFIEKPADPERLVETLSRAAAHRQLILENRALKEVVGGDRMEARLIGRSPAMERLRATTTSLADVATDVLLYGETGSGKELVARSLHDFGRRQRHPFVAINCGALPETMLEGELFGHEPGAFTGARERRVGKIEYANGGTLFLDEIESMPLVAQVRLLRVLQERCIERLGSNKEIAVDIRVVAATKVDLKALATSGQFREDLYYRLNVVTVRLPPLRERKEDIPLLFTHFLERSALQHGRPRRKPTYAEIAGLLTHDWPGNVRELRNAAERMALGIEEPAVSSISGIDDRHPAHAGGIRPLADVVNGAERAAIIAALQECGGRVGRAADSLGLTRKTLYLKMRKYDLDKGEFRLEEDITDLEQLS